MFRSTIRSDRQYRRFERDSIPEVLRSRQRSCSLENYPRRPPLRRRTKSEKMDNYVEMGNEENLQPETNDEIGDDVFENMEEDGNIYVVSQKERSLDDLPVHSVPVRPLPESAPKSDPYIALPYDCGHLGACNCHLLNPISLPQTRVHQNPLYESAHNRDTDVETPLKTTSGSCVPTEGITIQPDIQVRHQSVSVVKVTDSTNAQAAYDQQKGAEMARDIHRSCLLDVVLKLEGKKVTQPGLHSIVVCVRPKKRLPLIMRTEPPQDGYDSDVESQDEETNLESIIVKKFNQDVLLGLMKEACLLLGFSPVQGVRLGCIELLLGKLTPGQAQALLDAHQNGRLNTVLSKILLGDNDEYELEISIAENDLQKLALSNADESLCSNRMSDTAFEKALDGLLSKYKSEKTRALQSDSDQGNVAVKLKRKQLRKRTKLHTEISESSDEESMIPYKLWKPVPLIEPSQKHVEKQMKLSVTLQRLVEESCKDVQDKFARIKESYEKKDCIDELVVIEAKEAQAHIYMDDLERAQEKIKKAESYLPRTTHPLIMTLPCLLEQAELQVMDRKFGRVFDLTEQMKQIASQLCPGEIQRNILFAEARFLLHYLSFTHTAKNGSLEKKVLDNLDKSMNYFQNGKDSSNLARSLLMRCILHLHLLGSSWDHGEGIPKEDLEKSWHCLEHLNSRLDKVDRTKRIQCLYLLVLAGYSYRTSDRDAAVNHARQSVMLARHCGFVTIEKECNKRYQQLLEEKDKRQIKECIMERTEQDMVKQKVSDGETSGDSSPTMSPVKQKVLAGEIGDTNISPDKHQRFYIAESKFEHKKCPIIVDIINDAPGQWNNNIIEEPQNTDVLLDLTSYVTNGDSEKTYVVSRQNGNSIPSTVKQLQISCCDSDLECTPSNVN